MPRLSSPDPIIDALLALNPSLQTALQTFIDEGKYVSRRILPGFWQKFLESPHGAHWRHRETEPDDVPDPPPSLLPKTDAAIRAREARDRTVPAPPQDDLFDLLA